MHAINYKFVFLHFNLYTQSLNLAHESVFLFIMYVYIFFSFKFVMVRFTQTDQVEVAPTNWLTNTRTIMWPKRQDNSTYLIRSIAKRFRPDDNYAPHDVIVLYLSGVYIGVCSFCTINIYVSKSVD